ncbi:bile acid:sodium symporter family protein [Planococcus sp. N028]|uniref:Bile acid:sodium symporter family protein n=1 Tax=Planococcus shixiaomingii TaxID=3058393 RepID=A0ABT8MZ00_9BACL|nr:MULTISPECIES: bile acid:sodium symporter family protein [unclassified Planococcus (in: firmicutes)]MDN7240820.1 bile acid:sodium symporter family protein [Planococcus sp. N028]WKA53065.1 bile acid:sodium symporter family protein [Planococcus sp. N022]
MKFIEVLSAFAGKYFAFLVVGIAVLAFFIPAPFVGFGGYIAILLGIVMFGMGLTLKPVDFKIVASKPLPVITGVCAQFIIMPLVAFALAYILQLPPELAAGLILLGCVPGGTASNVMVYLAKGNVALSVAMTSLSTLLAPIVTPLLLLLLAGQWMPVDPVAMFMSIIQVIIVPIALGLIISKFFPKAVEKSISVVPLISVIAILIIVSAVTAANAENVVSAGFVVFVAVFLHNGFGLLLGYFTAVMLGLNENDRRAISIEVGMQNSGLGVALATAHFSPLAALPSVWGAIWHNISGPILATIWSKKPVKEERTGRDAVKPKAVPTSSKL